VSIAPAAAKQSTPGRLAGPVAATLVATAKQGTSVALLVPVLVGPSAPATRPGAARPTTVLEVEAAGCGRAGRKATYRV
jgi:hypothetical protein